MMQRAKKAEKRAARPAFKPGQSIFGAKSIASPDADQQNQSGMCGPLCSLNLMDLPVQTKSEPNHTGLPDRLKTGIESLSGMDMSDVRVHANSDKPERLNALAYAQGNSIHLAPGQEQHLPHEAWHLVQQRQGRVKPTLQAKGVGINDEPGLEREAERMGEKAARVMPGGLLGLNAKREAAMQLISEDEEEVLKNFIIEKEMDILSVNSPGRADSILKQLKEKYKKMGKKELKTAKVEAEKMLNELKASQAASFSSSSDRPPQASSSSSSSGEAPQAAASSSSSGRRPKGKGSKISKYESFPSKFLGFSSPSRAPQDAEPPRVQEAVGVATLPPAGDFHDEPSHNARGSDVLAALGISAQVTRLPNVLISTNIPGRPQTPAVSYPTHLTIPNFDDIMSSQSVTRQSVIERMHITVETHGMDNDLNPELWFQDNAFIRTGWTRNSRNAVLQMKNEFIRRLNLILS